MKYTYSIYDLKAKLSQALKYVDQGQQVIVTDRGRPSFEIISFKEKEEGLEQRLENFKRQGIIRVANNKDPLTPIASRPGSVERFLKYRHRDIFDE